MLGDQLLDLVDPGAAERFDQFLVFHERKRWHCANLVLIGDLSVLVHVNLKEEHVQHGVRQSLNLWTDRLTWSAPGG